MDIRNQLENGLQGYVWGKSSPLTGRVRDKEIETLRGLACILLVLFHAVETVRANVSATQSDPLQILAGFFTPVRMPLFAFLSGYVFLTGLNGRAALLQALFKKYKRLGLPLISVTLIYWALRGIENGHLSIAAFVPMLILPDSHLWFLQAAILISTLVTAIFCLSRCSAPRTALVLYLASLVTAILFLSTSPEIFSLRGAVGLLPFFSAGLFMRSIQSKKPFSTTGMPGLRLVLGCLVLVMLALSYWRFENATIFMRGGIEGIAASCVVCTSLYLMRLRIKLLWLIGPYSYTIYLYHLLFISLGVRVAAALDVHAPALVMIAALALTGLAGAIAMHSVLAHSKWGAFLLLGVDQKKATTPRSAAPELAKAKPA